MSEPLAGEALDNARVIELLAEQFTQMLADADLTEVDLHTEATPAALWSGRALTIGDPFDDDQQPVEVSELQQGLGRKPWIEYSVACISWAYSGGLTVDQQRRDAAAVIDAVRRHLRTNPTLDGAVANARLGDQRWGVTEDEQGGTQLCAFTIIVLVLPK